MPITSQIIGDMTKIDPERSHGGNMLAERLPTFLSSANWSVISAPFSNQYIY